MDSKESPDIRPVRYSRSQKYARPKLRIEKKVIQSGPCHSFPDYRTPTSGANASQAALLFLSEEYEVEDVDETLRKECHELSRWYWYQALIDEAAQRGLMKRKMKSASKSIVATITKVEEISQVLQYYGINGPFQDMASVFDGLDFDLLLYQLGAIQAFCDDFASLSFSKLGTASQRCRSVCWALWRLREELTGSPFKKNFDAAVGGKGATGQLEKEFVTPDARFVQVVMTAIDPSVEFKTIRTGLLNVAKRPPGSVKLGPVRNARPSRAPKPMR